MGEERKRIAVLLGILGAFWVGGASPCQNLGAVGEIHGMGTRWIPPEAVVVGPVFTDCGRGRITLPGGGRTFSGCPSAVVYVPGRYEPVPMEGWKLVGKERRYTVMFTYECVSHWILGIFPLPISKECVGPGPGRRMADYVYSWEAVPEGWPGRNRMPVRRIR